MSEDSREFKNNLPSYDGSTLVDKSGLLCQELRERVLSRLDTIMEDLKVGAEAERTLNSDNFSLYTGSLGMACVHLLMHDKLGGASKDAHLTSACKLMEAALPRLKEKRVTFLCGDAGPLTLGAIIYERLGKSSRKADCIKKLVHLSARVVSDASLPDEVLYGRAGYLFALMLVRQNCGAEAVDIKLMEEVVRSMLASGRQGAKALGKSMGSSPPSLVYSWHDKVYLGAAHGLAGIYYLLLKASAQFKDSLREEVVQEVKSGVDWMLRHMFPSGNTPSSLGSNTDRLVQWCHGAPGWIYLFLEAAQVYKDSQYLEAARRMGESTWQRGLLKKGCGICHGTAGNAYAFLALYRHTHQAEYLHRTYKFAEWCFDYHKHRTRIPDTEFSLFEGLAGTVYFLVDLLKPAEARFPGFEL